MQVAESVFLLCCRDLITCMLDYDWSELWLILWSSYIVPPPNHFFQQVLRNTQSHQVILDTPPSLRLSCVCRCRLTCYFSLLPARWPSSSWVLHTSWVYRSDVRPSCWCSCGRCRSSPCACRAHICHTFSSSSSQDAGAWRRVPHAGVRFGCTGSEETPSSLPRVSGILWRPPRPGRIRIRLVPGGRARSEACACWEIFCSPAWDWWSVVYKEFKRSPQHGGVHTVSGEGGKSEGVSRMRERGKESSRAGTDVTATVRETWCSFSFTCIDRRRADVGDGDRLSVRQRDGPV